jgi:hypothetical protein
MGIKRLLTTLVLAASVLGGLSVAMPAAGAATWPSHPAEGHWANPAPRRLHHVMVADLTSGSKTVTSCSGSYCTSYQKKAYYLRLWVDCGGSVCDFGKVEATKNGDVFDAWYDHADGTSHAWAERIIRDGREVLWVQVQEDKRSTSGIDYTTNDYLRRV